MFARFLWLFFQIFLKEGVKYYHGNNKQGVFELPWYYLIVKI